MDIALLGLRLVVGLGFAAHGAQKLFGVLGGHGLEGTGSFFEQIGLRPGWLHARAAGSAEFLGGLLIALGLFTPFAAAALIGVMTAAIITAHLPKGFFSTDGGYEYNLTLIAAVFALAGVGVGGWSLDSALGFDIAGTLWALGALAAGVLGGLGAVASGRLSQHGSDAGQPHAV